MLYRVHNRGMKRLLVPLLVLQMSCATQPEMQNQQVAEKGCMTNADCTDGKVCATVKGEYPRLLCG